MLHPARPVLLILTNLHMSAVTEYQLHAFRCGRCGVVTRTPLPEVPERAFGPRLQALVAVLSRAYRLSKRNLQQSLTDCFGVELALGGLDETELSACTQICYLSFLMVFMPTNGKTAVAASDVELVKAGKL